MREERFDSYATLERIVYATQVQGRQANDWPGWSPPTKAFQGVLGEVVQTVALHTEADPVALIVHLLVAFGNLVGPGISVVVDREQPINLYAVVVAPSAWGRKGTAWSIIRSVLGPVAPTWLKTRVIEGGITSGEGITAAFRPRDKRLLTVEEEFGKVFAVRGRRGSTVSETIRQAWDGGELSSLTKRNPIRVTGAYLSIIGHITLDELRERIHTVDLLNGFANRFLWVCVDQARVVPRASAPPKQAMQDFQDRLQRAARLARHVRKLARDEQSNAAWERLYMFHMLERFPGPFGAVVARAPTQVMRLASLYALADCSNVIRLEHLEAAWDLWRYCEASARYLFGGRPKQSVDDTILRAIQTAASNGLTERDLKRRFGSYGADQITKALESLETAGAIRREHKPSSRKGGRPTTRWQPQ